MEEWKQVRGGPQAERTEHPEIPFSIPECWEVTLVKDVFDIRQGKQVSKRKREGDNQRPFLRTRNVMWGSLDLADLDQMHFTEKEETRLELQPGDLLLCEGGWVGRTALWRGEVERCYYQNHLHRLRSLSGKVLPAFGLYWFWYAFEIAKLYYGRFNSTAIANMSMSRLGGLPILVPPFDEQQKIAEMLSTVHEAIEQHDRLIDLTGELKKTLMHKLFTEGTHGEPQKETEVGPVPESWEVIPLGDILTETKYGLSVRGAGVGTYPILRMTNQVNGRIVPDDLQYVDIPEKDFSRFAVERGDVLFNRTNSFEHVGRTAIFDLEGDYVFASYLIRLKTDRNKLSPSFLSHYFNYQETQKRLKTIATRAVGQSNISASRLKGFPVPLPSKSEQTEIDGHLDILDAALETHRGMKASLTDLFRTLLHELMTGVTRVDKIDLGKALAPRLEQAGLPLAAGKLDLDEIEAQTMGENGKP